MSREQILNNAQIVLANEVVRGCVVLEDGRIREISSTMSQSPAAQDMQGDYVMPGFIELHTDNLERYMNPRPGVDWPSSAAVLAHDAQLVSSGITTVFDALSIGDVSPKQTRLAQLPKMIEAIGQGVRDGLTRSDHLLHLRCEVSHELTLQMFEELVDHELVKLVSVMDHTPGQRQFVKIEKYREYYQGKYHLSDAEMEAFIHKQTTNAAKYSEEFRKSIVGMCQSKGIALASHDDATAAHVNESAAAGMTIAEFPTTREAADLSHQLGLNVLMGAPNIVRGGSHSGNIAAAELARHGVLDILSSDYYPSSLLQAVHGLTTMEQGYSLPRAVSTVSLAPATAVGLHDRGEIAVGKRADLIQVKDLGKQFIVKQVFSQGQRVY
ncbi:alpha-D-ribose 1-methylphosphonate 5-triphosphate diphosphatase [Paenalcaligenes suwonensis]|uniref:alpha-D-ribose 1-methylphosphonate 5-triphosphate diphosphatase n=1 Tax=Paenalcaligenes suwonensis TaxID=1202713 RepID=UPI0014088D51|nr:alpha-D-ribose 1-methylphosphonate 5-triphosphate diphosphatase [Paenalcaligenes suwonensis]NHC61056.1 alpha-D-ribose 1-methylphosphonate 5-triphosphate diphosphatase [Paenalcaligenes suwonensis]